MNAAALKALSNALRSHGVDKPVVVVDLDLLDANCVVANRVADAGLARRLVAKSLPCLPLLDFIRERISTSGLMTFSEPMLQALLTAEPDTDNLIGKPLPVSMAARLLTTNHDAARRVQWLIDTPARLGEYLALASDRQTSLRLSLELDIGLHRGGLNSQNVPELAQQIMAHPYGQLAGVMGYEAHLAKLPGILRNRAARASADAFNTAVAALPRDEDGLCLNIGGSLTFQSYLAEGSANEVAFGSVLVWSSCRDKKRILRSLAATSLPSRFSQQRLATQRSSAVQAIRKCGQAHVRQMYRRATSHCCALIKARLC
jgi:D-serine deaminase-like pyridoxal phosphate-dependent protein